MGRLRLLTAVLMVLPLLVAGGPSAASATGEVGHDVSWPQCGGSLPKPRYFAVVGVTRSLPFTKNECLGTEVAWAAQTGEWSLYANTANPGWTDPHWPETGVGFCRNASTSTDLGCAYEYGSAAAAFALNHAWAALSGSGRDPTRVPWWLDVETYNDPWVGSGRANTAVIQGFADELVQNGVPEVGVYSTAYQWEVITGGYHRSNARSYRTAWGFPVQTALEDGPTWYGNVKGIDVAKQRCAEASFTGGERLLAQFLATENGVEYDFDYRCRDADRTRPTRAITGPASRVALTPSVPVTWAGADTGGSGLASFDLRAIKAPYDGGFGAWQLPAATTRLLGTSLNVRAPDQGWTQCFQVRSRDGAGNLSDWSPSRCTAVPLDDRRLLASPGWTRATTRGWFQGTSTATTQQGATLRRSGLQTKRLHLVALRCPTCGKVGVYLGTQLLATVDLASAVTTRAVVTLPVFSLREASVTVKVLSSGKTVRVDALASSRA